MPRKHITNFASLLLLPFFIGGLLAVAMGGAGVGLRLFFLSLFGIYPTLCFIRHKKQGKRPSARLFLLISACWWLIFCTHSLILSLSWLMFGGGVDSFFIIQAISNTTAHETLEFIRFYWVTLIMAIMVLMAIIVGYYAWLLRFFDIDLFDEFKTSKSYRGLFVFFALLALSAYLIKPSRNHSPFVFWTKYAQKIQQFHLENAQHKNYHTHWLNLAKEQITSTNQDNQTHLLVISESLTSKNMGVCGYPRNTTPLISEQQQELMIFCRAYSRHATTIDAIKSMLTDLQDNPQDTPTQSVLAFAKTAGFKVFWISNQNDAYLSSLFGDFADVSIYHNKLGGRSSMSMDEEILPYVDDALTDTHHKKLIVVHLIGSHPNYSSRYPETFNRFPNDKQGLEQINAQFDKHDIGLITKKHRDTYDNSVVYQDWIFHELFAKIKSNNSDVRSLTFLSDHGNEVGHEKDHAGHSANTEAGFQIPIILWQNKPMTTGVNHKDAIDASLLDNYLITLMGIETKTPQPSSWTDEHYRFMPSQNFPYWQSPD